MIPGPGFASEELFHDSDRYFARMMDEIDRADRAIEFETYIYDSGILGDRLLEHLTAAARRGVSVRVMVDAFGAPNWNHDYHVKFIEAGVEARIYHPPPWSLLALRFDLHRMPGTLQAFLRKVNKRNHRKICVIDGTTAWIGSANVSDLHLRECAGDAAWRDTGVRVSGGEVAALRRAFDIAWEGTPDPPRVRLRPAMKPGDRRYFEGASQVRLNNQIRLRRLRGSEFLRHIRRARSRVWLATPYFVPTGSLLRALRLAARSGADVRLLLPRRADLFFMPWVNQMFHYGLLRSGARIYEYLPRFFHAKIAITDDWAIVGTSNLNHRSLIHDLEVDIVLIEENSRNELKIQYELDLENSEEITMARWRDRPRWQRLLGRMTLLLYYWI